MSHLVSATLPNGLRLVIEPMASARSAAITWLLPVGSAGDPDDRQGESAMLSDLVFRGAGGKSSRELSEALDRLGVDRSSRVTPFHLEFEYTCVGAKVADVLPLATDIIRRPALEDEAVDSVRSLCLQSLDGLRDDPQHFVMLKLFERHQPAPFNRHGFGERAALESLQGADLRAAWSKRAVPAGSILAIAGGVDPDAITRQMNELLDGWTGRGNEPATVAEPERGTWHESDETAQVHVGLAYDAPPEPHEDAVRERLATAVLSGGMSGRLFTEVRERRSLVYSVSARYHGGRDRGNVRIYAGTTPERAQETLDVIIQELNRLREGVTAEEFHRAVVGVKSRLVMQGESTGARAINLAADIFRLGRGRTLSEVAEEVESITIEDLNNYLAARDWGEFTVASMGPKALVRPEPLPA